MGLRDTVLSVLTGGPRQVPHYWKQVVSDTIDADLCDYLRRDAHYTGLELRYDRRVVDYFRVDRASQRMFVDCEKNGMLREDIVSELVRMLEIRYHFSERVYYHHAKIAAGALLSRMVELALRGGALTPADLQRATDESLVLQLGNARLGTAAETERLQRFVAAYRRRRLPKRVLVLPAYLNLEVQQQLLDTWFQPGRPEPRFEWKRASRPSARRPSAAPSTSSCTARPVPCSSRRHAPSCASPGPATAPCRSTPSRPTSPGCGTCGTATPACGSCTCSRPRTTWPYAASCRKCASQPFPRAA